VATDAEGFLSFEFPAWTHGRLEAEGHEIQYGWMIPDSVRQMTVTAAPTGAVALKVRPAEGQKLPDYLLAGEGESGKRKTYFERVRVLPDRSAIYIAGVRDGAAMANVMGRQFEIDLSGGWAEPLDLRPEPQG
jgi:hypothetical protein